MYHNKVAFLSDGKAEYGSGSAFRNDAVLELFSNQRGS
jgi:hypothetical protein